MSVDRYAVFGYPINHSKSPRIHALFAEQTDQALSYSAIEVPAEHFNEEVTAFFANGGKGLNCTVPLKELAWAFADRLTERAQLSKAVNTLKLEIDGSILGDNTDGFGLVQDLLANHDIDLTGKRLLILGAGGAARGIIGPLLEQKPHSMVIANRTVDKAERLADEFEIACGSDVKFAPLGPVTGCGFDDLRDQQFDCILNATSASLTGQLPTLPENLLAKSGICYDLTYGNRPTPFVLWGQEQHAAKSLDGLGMLVEQAAEAFLIWRNAHPNTRSVIDLLNAERSCK